MIATLDLYAWKSYFHPGTPLPKGENSLRTIGNSVRQLTITRQNSEYSSRSPHKAESDETHKNQFLCGSFEDSLKREPEKVPNWGLCRH
jgi:hypothetical protein